MHRILKNYGMIMVIIILVIGGLILCPLKASADTEREYARFPTEKRSAESMVFDLAMVRILSLAGLVVGTGAFLVSLPFSVPGGNAEEAYERLMADPARYTFKRPLGEF